MYHKNGPWVVRELVGCWHPQRPPINTGLLDLLITTISRIVSVVVWHCSLCHLHEAIRSNIPHFPSQKRFGETMSSTTPIVSSDHPNTKAAARFRLDEDDPSIKRGHSKDRGG
eukprot:scaffold80904_cov56-Attheya_sp.AAC.3